MNKTDPLLFDTQAVIHWAAGEIPDGLIARVEGGAEAYVSIVSLWEFLFKSRYNNVGITFEDLRETISDLRASFIGIKLPHLETLRRLPFVGSHRDPFDRLIIAQAISEGYVLVGKDREFPKYSETTVGRQLMVLWD